MNGGFGKIFPRLFTGSLMGDGQAQLVMAYAIANAGADHEVELNPGIMAACFGPMMDISDIAGAIKRLASPHEQSSSKAEEGRCIVPRGPNIYFLVNHEQHRDGRADPERLRAQKAAWARKNRGSRESKPAPSPSTVTSEYGISSPKTPARLTAPTAPPVRDLPFQANPDKRVFIPKDQHRAYTDFSTREEMMKYLEEDCGWKTWFAREEVTKEFLRLSLIHI